MWNVCCSPALMTGPPSTPYVFAENVIVTSVPSCVPTTEKNPGEMNGSGGGHAPPHCGLGGTGALVICHVGHAMTRYFPLSADAGRRSDASFVKVYPFWHPSAWNSSGLNWYAVTGTLDFMW